MQYTTKTENKNIRVNALHPATLMNTKMVLEYWGKSSATVNWGPMDLIICPQAYDVQVRTMLRNVTWDLL